MSIRIVRNVEIRDVHISDDGEVACSRLEHLALNGRVVSRILQDLANFSDGVHDLVHRLRNRATKLVLVHELQFRQVLLRHLWGEEWEQAVDAVLSARDGTSDTQTPQYQTDEPTYCWIVPGKVSEQQPGERRTERAVVRIPSAVLEAPCCEVGSCMEARSAVNQQRSRGAYRLRGQE